MQVKTLLEHINSIERNSYLYEGLDREHQELMKLWEGVGYKLKEATLTPTQIQQIFQSVEQNATGAGGNRTLIGQGKDAAGAVNKAWEDLKTKVYNSKPMSNFAGAYDQAAEKLKQATGGDQGVFKYVQKYRDFAEKHPILQSLIYSALIAAAGITGAGVGGAAILGLFKLFDQLLQGKDVRSAIYQGAKTGAMAYGASKLGDLIKGKPEGNVADTAGKASDTAAGVVNNISPQKLAKGALDIVKEKIANGEVTDYNSYQEAVYDALQTAAKNSGGTASQTSQQMASNMLKMYLDRYAADASGNFVGSGPEKVAKIITALGGNVDADKLATAQRAVSSLSGAKESISFKPSTIQTVFATVALMHNKRIDEGIWDTVKGKAQQFGKNLTTKITADKLNSAWQSAGSPTDSAEVANLLKQNGVSDDIVNTVFKSMKISTKPAGQQSGTDLKALIKQIHGLAPVQKQKIMQALQKKLGVA